MSTVDRRENDDSPTLELIHNSDAGTVTLSPRPEEDIRLAATEWLTITAEDLVDLKGMQ
jgi:hypothetical protein